MMIVIVLFDKGRLNPFSPGNGWSLLLENQGHNHVEGVVDQRDEIEVRRDRAGAGDLVRGAHANSGRREAGEVRPDERPGAAVRA